MSYETYAFLGASISDGYFDESGRGWARRLFDKLNHDQPGYYRLYLLSQSGDRSFDFLHRLSSEAIQRQSDNLIIEVAGNDLTRHNKSDAPTDLSPALREEVWKKILDLAKKNFKKIYIVSGIPKNPQKMPMVFENTSIYYLNEDVKEYSDQVKKLADNEQVFFIDIFNNLYNDAFFQTLEDGDHPNTQGHIMIAETVYKKFKEIGF